MTDKDLINRNLAKVSTLLNSRFKYDHLKKSFTNSLFKQFADIPAEEWDSIVAKAIDEMPEGYK